MSIGTGPNSIVVDLSEDAYQGNAEFTISVDGHQIGGTQTVTAAHDKGQEEAFTVLGTFAAGSHTVSVDYLNDTYGGSAATDRNLYVGSITTAAGTVTTDAGLGVDGSKSFTTAGTPAPLTVGTGPDSLVLHVSEDAYLGNAEFTVSVDGKQIGGTLTATALHGDGQTQAVSVLGNFGAGAHTVSVDFLNDAYGGTATTDRNLYVNSVTYGSTTTNTNTALVSNGSANLAFQVPGDPPATTPPATTPPTATPPATTSPASTPSAPSGNAPAYYVAVNGSDTTGNGTEAKPFASLSRAQTAMEGSSIRTTYVEGGTYELTSNLNLTSADNGMSFISAPGQHAVLDGSAHSLINLITLNGAQHVTLQGLTFENTTPGHFNGAVSLLNATSNTIVGNLFTNNDRGVLLTGSSNNVISGNEMNNSVLAGVNAGANSNNNTIDSNLINGTSLQGTGTGSSGVWITGGNDNAITHNLIENTAGTGIALANWTTAASNLNVGNTIAYNSIVNADSSPLANDSGGIYIDGRAGVDTHTTVNNNSVNLAVSPTTGDDVGIYLDDFTSGVVASNNIVTGGNLSFLVHGGENDTLTNNVFDLGTRSASTLGAGLLQAESGGPIASMTGDVVTKNILYSTATSPWNAWVSYGGAASVSNNLYYNTNNQSVNAGMDTSPKTGNPAFANVGAGNFALGSGSAASAVGFQAINQSAIGLAPTTAHYF